jgi:hypothetical protein
MNEISEFLSKYGRETIEAVVAIFTGYLLYENRRQKNSNEGFPNLVKAQEEVISRLSRDLASIMDKENLSTAEERSLRIEIANLKKQIEMYVEEINHKYNNIDLFRDFCEHIPTPMWMKKTNLDGGHATMLFINQAYEIQWKISKVSYEGKTDMDVWPEKIANAFAKIDEEVSRKAITIVTKEQVPLIPFNKISKDNPLRNWIIWKFPIISEDEVVGVGGVAIRCENDNPSS